VAAGWISKHPAESETKAAPKGAAFFIIESIPIHMVMGDCMKTTVEIPDELAIDTSQETRVENRTTIRAPIESGLRHELGGEAKRAVISWVTVPMLQGLIK
jgi:hypothetical protein